MSSVKLMHTFWWECPCGNKQTVEPLEKELTLDELEEEYRHHNGVPEWEVLPNGWDAFKVVIKPDIVVCEVCGQSHDVAD